MRRPLLARCGCTRLSGVLAQGFPQKKAAGVSILRSLSHLLSPAYLAQDLTSFPHCLTLLPLESCHGPGFLGKSKDRSSEDNSVWDHGKAVVIWKNHEQILTGMGCGTGKFDSDIGRKVGTRARLSRKAGGSRGLGQGISSEPQRRQPGSSRDVGSQSWWLQSRRPKLATCPEVPRPALSNLLCTMER